MRIFAIAAALVGSAAAWAAAAQEAPQPTAAEALFVAHCKQCHEPAIDRAPPRTAMAERSPADIAQVLTDGPMKPMAAGLSADEIRALAAYLGSGPANGLASAGGARRGARPPPPPVHDVMCTANPPIQPGPNDWSNWGVDAANTRYQKAGGVAAADIPRLKVKWAFSVRGGAYGQPTVVGDWLFLATRGGGFYALDANSGCVHWHIDDNSRTTPVILRSPVSPSGWITFLGEQTRVVKAFDAQTGKPLWTSPALETNPVAGITGPIIASGDQLFVPLTSGEEGAGTQPNYPCCSFRGSLAALDMATGRLEWQTHVINEPLKPIRRNPSGTMLQGPAGGAIWSSATVDAKRGLVFVATGDSYTDAPTKGADAIVAMDTKTGAIRWSTQVTRDDNFIVGCTLMKHSDNCPTPSGPDYDFGSPPILFTLPSGRRVVLSGQKSGIAYAMDETSGKVLWKSAVGAGSSLGGIEWGMAADGKRLYVPNADTIVLMDEYLRPLGQQVLSEAPPAARSGLSALDPATGRIIWSTPAPKAPCHYAGDRSHDRVPNGPCINAQSAAVTAIPGAVLSGTLDGWFRAYDARTGKIVWAFSTTAQTYQTVNGVSDQPGGSIDSMGPTVAGGKVFLISGYSGASNTGGNPLNVLLALSPDGR